jgi:hypothetical protein
VSGVSNKTATKSLFSGVWRVERLAGKAGPKQSNETGYCLFPRNMVGARFALAANYIAVSNVCHELPRMDLCVVILFPSLQEPAGHSIPDWARLRSMRACQGESSSGPFTAIFGGTLTKKAVEQGTHGLETDTDRYCPEWPVPLLQILPCSLLVHGLADHVLCSFLERDSAGGANAR